MSLPAPTEPQAPPQKRIAQSTDATKSGPSAPFVVVTFDFHEDSEIFEGGVKLTETIVNSEQELRSKIWQAYQNTYAQEYGGAPEEDAELEARAAPELLPIPDNHGSPEWAVIFDAIAKVNSPFSITSSLKLLQTFHDQVDIFGGNTQKWISVTEYHPDIWRWANQSQPVHRCAKITTIPNRE